MNATTEFDGYRPGDRFYEAAVDRAAAAERTHTLAQPFARINAPTPCRDPRRHAAQIVPVAGNADRSTPVFVVNHGPRHYLTLAGEVTTTPVWLTWTEAEHAEEAHAERGL